jgi:hypothetical protein
MSLSVNFPKDPKKQHAGWFPGNLVCPKTHCPIFSIIEKKIIMDIFTISFIVIVLIFC